MKGLQITLIVSVVAIIVSSTPVEQEKRLIKTNEDDEGTWLTEDEIWILIRNDQTFIDITDHSDMPTRVKPQDVNTKAIPSEIQFPNETRSVLENIDGTRIENFVRYFSNFHNRYYKARTGRNSQQWLLSQVQQALGDYNEAKSSVQEFEHSWSQRSIIARIEGTDPELKSEVIILGAHQDSINMMGGTFKAPGADDNASGSAVILEALRVIVDSRFAPKRTVEFHWYAAEEVGLRGSAAIAQQYKHNDVDVVGMINFDVSGYQDPRYNDIGIYTDNAHPVLTQFLRVLVDEYLEYGRRDETCGYGCSDHASWTGYGYAAAMPAEVTLHPLMHTQMDDYQRVGFVQVKEFVKLASAFIVEFGEPSSTE